MSLPDLPDLRERIAEKSAELSVQGVGENAQAEKLSQEFGVKVTRTDVKHLRSHPKYREATIVAIEGGKLNLQARALGEYDTIVKCLVSEISSDGKDKIRAASILADIILNKGAVSSDGPKQATSIQVILPGFNEKEVDEKPVLVPVAIQAQKN